jgi:hypothetical protein
MTTNGTLGKNKRADHELSESKRWKASMPMSRKTGLGDLMGFERSLPPGFDHFPPLDRVVLTANGNLQRIVSSFNNAPVQVNVLRNVQVATGKYNREVSITCAGQEFCVATSKITIRDADMIQAVESKKVGIGQLFRKYDLLPQFTLLKTQRNGDNFFRIYVLKVRCKSCGPLHVQMSINYSNTISFAEASGLTHACVLSLPTFTGHWHRVRNL